MLNLEYFRSFVHLEDSTLFSEKNQITCLQLVTCFRVILFMLKFTLYRSSHLEQK